MSDSDIEAIRANGVSIRWPAGRYQRFAANAVKSLVDTTTEMDARALGYEGTWRMRIVSAEVVDDGAAINLRLIPDS